MRRPRSTCCPSSSLRREGWHWTGTRLRGTTGSWWVLSVHKDYVSLEEEDAQSSTSLGSVLLEKSYTSYCQSGKNPHKGPIEIQVGQSLSYQALRASTRPRLGRPTTSLMVVGLPSSGTAHILSVVTGGARNVWILSIYRQIMFFSSRGEVEEWSLRAPEEGLESCWTIW